MDILSATANPEDVLVTFRWAMSPGEVSREAPAFKQREHVAQKGSPNEEEQASPDKAVLSEIAKGIEPRISTFKNTGISFSINKDLGKMVVKVIDKDTDEVIRQIPPEEMIRLMARMTEIVGMLMDEKV